MSVFNWKNPTSGSWTSAAHWAPGSVPGADGVADGTVPVSDADVIFATGSQRSYSVTGHGMSNSMTVTGDHVTFTNFSNSNNGFGGSLAIDQHADVTLAANSSVDYIAHDGIGGGTISVSSALLMDHGSITAASGSVTGHGMLEIAGSGATAETLTGVAIAKGGRMLVADGAHYSAITYMGVPEDIDGTLTIRGADSSAQVVTLSGTGVVSVTHGASLDVVGWISGGLTLDLGHNASADVGASVSSGTTIDFTGHHATLTIADAAPGSYAMSATILGFNHTDSLVLDGSPVTNVAYTQTSASGGSLALFDGTTQVGTLALAGNYLGDSFAATAVSDTETRISMTGHAAINLGAGLDTMMQAEFQKLGFSPSADTVSGSAPITSAGYDAGGQSSGSAGLLFGHLSA